MKCCHPVDSDNIVVNYNILPKCPTFLSFERISKCEIIASVAGVTNCSMSSAIIFLEFIIKCSSLVSDFGSTPSKRYG